MSSIFISHATEDGDFAHRLATDLKGGGYQAVTYADLEAAKGEGDAAGLEKRLAGAITSADYFVPVLTTKAQERRWFQEDLTRALSREAPYGGVTILPVLKEQCILHESLGLRTPVDFSESYIDGLHSLVDRLTASVPDAGRIDPVLEPLSQEVMTSLGENQERLRRMSPTQLEAFVGEMFRRLKWTVEVTQLSYDGGIDFVVVGGRDKSLRSYLVQCKRYAPGRRFAVEVVKSIRPIEIDSRRGRAHIVSTSLFVDPRKKRSGQLPECLTRDRWELSLLDWNAMKAWLAPYIDIAEPPVELDRARERHAALVDKKFGSALSSAEQAELLHLQLYLDEADAKFYEPIKKKLELELAGSSPSVET